MRALISAAIVVGALWMVGGCAVDGDDPVAELGVPKGAVMVKEGEGRLAYEPDRDGHVWVYDADDDRLVFERDVNANEKFVVDARDNRIALNGERVSTRDLRSNHRHRIYFRRERE